MGCFPRILSAPILSYPALICMNKLVYHADVFVSLLYGALHDEKTKRLCEREWKQLSTLIKLWTH